MRALTKPSQEKSTQETECTAEARPLRKSLHQLARFTKNLLSSRLPEIVLLSEILLYSAIFSYFTLQKFREFSIYAWDFGVYSQAISTTVTSGTLFYSTLELPYTQTVIPTGTQFAVHFTPILFAILPPYALLPSIERRPYSRRYACAEDH